MCFKWSKKGGKIINKVDRLYVETYWTRNIYCFLLSCYASFIVISFSRVFSDPIFFVLVTLELSIYPSSSSLSHVSQLISHTLPHFFLRNTSTFQLLLVFLIGNQLDFFLLQFNSELIVDRFLNSAIAIEFLVNPPF
jgi:hypothetical protein